jgi:hypothetical protein
MFSLFLKACPDQAANYTTGREPDGTASRSWNWQQPAGQPTQPPDRTLPRGTATPDPAPE